MPDSFMNRNIPNRLPEMESSSDDDKNQERDGTVGSKGLANVMAKILHKQTPKKVILAKSKTDKEITLSKQKQGALSPDDTLVQEEGETVTFLPNKKRKKEDEESSDESDNEEWHLKKERQMKKKVWEEMCHVKPDILDRETERNLQRIATKGVVQLFNAVKKQQKIVSEKLTEAGPSERRKEKVMQSVTKGHFMDVLKGTAVNVVAEGKPQMDSKSEKGKKEVAPAETENPSWSILKDNFMMDAKMKDWDKESNDESTDNDNISSESETN